VIILATLLFLLCVLLNAYMTAFTADTLLRFVSLFLPSHRQPSMQSQFEFHIYKHEAAAALPLLFLLFALRDPNRVQFVDLFTFLRSIVDGFLATCRSAVSPLVRPHVQNWLWLLGYLLAGVGFDVAYAWLVRYSNAVFRWECEGGFTQLVRASGRVRGDAGDHVGVRGALRGEWGRLIFRTCPRTTR
jgi:singapore isolate B (sub-type 7) whole genome shotgun sequence assembly, scaffold_1